MTLKEVRKRLVKAYQDLGNELDKIYQELKAIENSQKNALERQG